MVENALTLDSIDLIQPIFHDEKITSRTFHSSFLILYCFGYTFETNLNLVSSLVMIHFCNVTKHYESGQTALSNISFKLEIGEMAFLTGHSGAGKSTLLKLIALLEKPSSGDVIVHGKNLSRFKKSSVPLLRRKIGLIFQSPLLLPTRTIFDNVMLPLNIVGFRQSEASHRVRAALHKVGLSEKGKCYPHMLSCGEQQRVSIARAIVTKPAIILADEPTGNLDPDLAKDIMKLFIELNQTGSTLLIATHDMGLIETLPFRILTLKGGQLIRDIGRIKS